MTISTGGSYTGCWSSNNPNTPAVNVTTSSPVSIVNSGIQSKGHGIRLAPGGRLTVRNSSITILNPDVAGVVKNRWIYAPGFASATIENNDLTSGRGVWLSDWTGTASDGVKFRYNRIRNVDGRASSGAGDTTTTWDVCTGFGVTFQLADSPNIPNVEMAWNEVVNTPGQSAVEDNFSFWMSSGTAVLADPRARQLRPRIVATGHRLTNSTTPARRSTLVTVTAQAATDNAELRLHPGRAECRHRGCQRLLRPVLRARHHGSQQPLRGERDSPIGTPDREPTSG